GLKFKKNTFAAKQKGTRQLELLSLLFARFKTYEGTQGPLCGLGVAIHHSFQAL
ncbi:hypothetical protein KI387_025957, partial [Taxus chinensis]